jgi:hypothetical protein
MVDYVLNDFILSYDNVIVDREIIIVSNLGFMLFYTTNDDD